MNQCYKQKCKFFKHKVYTRPDGTKNYDGDCENKKVTLSEALSFARGDLETCKGFKKK